MAREKLSNGNAPLKSMGVSASQPEKSSFLKSTFKSPNFRPSSSLPVTQAHVDESQVVIINSGARGGISQNTTKQPADDGLNGGDDESNSDIGSSISSEDDVEFSARGGKLTNGVYISAPEDRDVKMLEGQQAGPSGDAGEESDDAEPSFGDLVAKSTKQVSIDAALPPDSGTLVPRESSNQVAIGPGVSLSTVLTQALRTNDNNLLESCFHNTDTQIIRSTIQRIDPVYAGILMQKLAERLSSRPGRYGNLLVWVQWICVAHGGAIAGRPDVLSNVNTLYRVLDQRSKALDSLLLLKGKLDMLDAQLDFRKQLVTERGPASNPREGHLVYVEGQEAEDSSDEEDTIGDADSRVPPTGIRDKKDLGGLIPQDEDDSNDGEQMPLTNGIIAESGPSDFDSEEDEDGVKGQEDDLVDDEAEESDEESLASERAFDDSEDEGSDDEEDSEMNDFIDDGPVEEAESISISSLADTPGSPPVAKKRRR